jgi:hypothetical protein
MFDKDFRVLDEEDLADVQELVNVVSWMTPGMARVIVSLAALGEANYRQIEESTGMKSSHVSISISKLTEFGIVKQSSVVKNDQGKEIRAYTLCENASEQIINLVSDIAARERIAFEKAKKEFKALGAMS